MRWKGSWRRDFFFSWHVNEFFFWIQYIRSFGCVEQIIQYHWSLKNAFFSAKESMWWVWETKTYTHMHNAHISLYSHASPEHYRKSLLEKESVQAKNEGIFRTANSLTMYSFIYSLYVSIFMMKNVHTFTLTYNSKFHLMKAMNNFKFISVWSGYWIQKPKVYDCIFLTLHKMTFNKTKTHTHHTLHSTWQLMAVIFCSPMEKMSQKKKNSQIMELHKNSWYCSHNFGFICQYQWFGSYLIGYWRSHESK